ncbi:hypothetical protein PHISCL_04514 [Aspergillus sclerotialis]|uniref:F-box domain-containing protein n=1 Tax=Aspergillus sclerotialis TaxID=2070753 RepID=A0A3A2ZJ37_9EURO|nr:hypothetical protein PHISCL_04514 [Aspergillus sclerotialis]
MASISVLPPELLCLIFSYLDTLSLYEVSLTSKRFNSMSKDLLWKCCRGKTVYGAISYYALLRSILENPKLAHHVKKLHAYHDKLVFRCGTGDEAELKLFQDAIDTLDIPREAQKSHLKAAVMYNHGDPLIALLLCKLPNLQNFILQCGNSLRWTESILEYAAAGQLDVLKKLHTITVHYIYSDPLQSRLFRVLGLPSVKNFKAINACIKCNLETTLTPGLSSVENISLILSDMATNALQPLIQCSKALKSFVFTCGDSDDEEIPFNPYDAVQALRQHRSTLEELTIYMNNRWEIMDKNLPREKICIGNGLQDFEQLRALRCDMRCVWGFDYVADWREIASYVAEPDNDLTDLEVLLPRQTHITDALPRSIETLVIFDANEMIMPHLEGVRNVKAEQFPFLKEIIVFFNHLCTVRQFARKTRWELVIDGVKVTLNYINARYRAAEEHYVYETVGYDAQH